MNIHDVIPGISLVLSIGVFVVIYRRSVAQANKDFPLPDKKKK